MQDTKQTIARLKEGGAVEIGRGDFEKALKSFVAVLKEAPNDLHSLMKAGDLSYKLGQNNEACWYYDRLVELYAKEGFIVKAIAVHKLILKIDPNFPGGEKRLSNLYDQKIKEEGGTPAAVKGGGKGRPREYEKPPLFSDLSHDEFIALTDKLAPVEVAAGDVIVREGEAGDSIFIIVSGQVSVYRTDEDGNEVWITNLDEGAFFGEFGYFSGQKRFASVKAHTDSVLLEIGKRDIESITKTHSRVREVLLKFYKERVLDTLVAISPLFSVLSPEERKRFLDGVDFSSFGTGAPIVREGEPGDRMYVIISGEVTVSTDREGAVVELARLRSGDFFGEVSVITGRPRTATVTANTDTRLGEIARSSVREAMKAHPEIAERLERYIQMRVENTISAIMQFKNRKLESGLV